MEAEYVLGISWAWSSKRKPIITTLLQPFLWEYRSFNEQYPSVGQCTSYSKICLITGNEFINAGRLLGVRVGKMTCSSVPILRLYKSALALSVNKYD